VRKFGKVDANQTEIVDALRRVGATVHSLAPMGGGYPDLLVGWRGHTYLMEVKGPAGKLTDQQFMWNERWTGGNVFIVQTPVEALRVLGVEAK
jgi:hypothetical protein